MRMKYRFSTVLAAIGLVIGAFGLGAAPAAAADTETGSSSAGSSSASSSGESLEEILVTAIRFDVDVMHAPVSMTAINGDDLQRNEIHNTTDLQFFVPGLSVANQVLNTIINIRGMGSGFPLPTASQGVPIYRDNLLVPPNAGDEPLWDIQNVQVLRGPQGTLVGCELHRRGRIYQYGESDLGRQQWVRAGRRWQLPSLQCPVGCQSAPRRLVGGAGRHVLRKARQFLDQPVAA